jgi:arginine deiminase
MPPARSQSSSNSSNKVNNADKSHSILQKILKSRDFEVKRIKLLQSTLETIRNSLTYQSQFVVNYLNNTVLELPKLKERTNEQGLKPQDKQQRWKEYKRAIFCSLFNQLYAVRIANMVSLVTMT